jgi:hypothetical protein
MESKNKNMKVRIILGVIAVIGCVYLYHSFSKDTIKETAKETAIGLAKDAGKYALGKAKDKLHEKMAQNDSKGGAVLSQGQDPTVPTKTLDDFVNGAAVVQRNDIIKVEDGKQISIDNVGVTNDQADVMMLNAVKSSDLDQVKFLIKSGVKLDFTDNKLCTRGRIHDKAHFYQYEIPADVMTIKQKFKYMDPVYLYTTDCNKMFLQESYKLLKREDSDAEFAIFYGDAPNDAAKQRNAEQKIKREIFEVLLANTPKKDYYQFADAIANVDVPQDVRLKLTKLYIENIGTMPVSPARKKFLTMYETAAVELLQENPTNADWMQIATSYKAPLYTFFVKATDEATTWLATGVYQTNALQGNFDSVSKRVKMGNIILPELTVASTTAGEYTTDIKNVDATFIKMVSPKIYTNVKEFAFNDKFISLYLANRELQIMRLLKDSGKINMNMQNANGESILHYLVGQATQTSKSSIDRAAAIMIRYLLNSGVNPNLLSKKGETAHAMLQTKRNDYNKMYPNAKVTPFLEMQNAFTKKEFN